MSNNNLETVKPVRKPSSVAAAASVPAPIKKDSGNAKVLTIFLFSPYTAKNKGVNDFSHFFSKDLDDVIAKSQELPLFFNLDNALEHGRFLSNHFLLLKVLIPETAIVGQSHALYLKKNVLSKYLVHGCYPSWGNGQIYYRNPAFNSK